MSSCGKPIVTKLKGVLACAAGHHFRVAEDAPDQMTAVDPDKPDEPKPDGEMFPMGEVCPHPDYFAEEGPKKPVV